MSAKPATDLWKSFPTFERLVRCFYKASRGKKEKQSTLLFRNHLEEECLAIRNKLITHAYFWGEYRQFYVLEPKKRLIESAPFRDRVVHHAIHEVLEPLWESSLYDHSYACRNGKGSHRAMLKLHQWIKDKPEAHFLQLDIKKYFPSIDRTILSRIIRKKIGDQDFYDLIHSLIMGAPGERGIPIGNLTSQLFANIYLNEMDQYIKRVLKAEQYIRYMDDFILLGHSSSQMKAFKSKISHFLDRELKLSFHPNKVERGKVQDGITFVGYRIYPHGTWIKNSTLKRMRRKLTEKKSMDQKVRSLISFRGHLKHSKNFQILLDQLTVRAFFKGPYRSQAQVKTPGKEK